MFFFKVTFVWGQSVQAIFAEKAIQWKEKQHEHRQAVERVHLLEIEAKKGRHILDSTQGTHLISLRMQQANREYKGLQMFYT